MKLARQSDRIGGVRGFSHDLDIGFGREQCSDALPEKSVIVS